MDVNARVRKRITVQAAPPVQSLYPHDVSFFKSPPELTIDLSEFEDLAIERLQLLRILDEATLKGHRIFSDDWKQCVKEDCIKAGLKKFVRLIAANGGQNDLDFQARRADHISHYILRLAYCRSEDLRRWYLNRELEWFKLKFLNLSESEIKRFLEINNLTYVPIPVEEKEEIRNDLIASTAGLSDIQVETMNFYKVNFTDVISLVKTRRVFLKNGSAFIPTTELVVCIQAKYRASLNEALNIYFRRLPSLDDDRVTGLLSNLNEMYTGKDYSTTHLDKEELDPNNIELYAKEHYPLCMQHIHKVLKATHHLKHWARLQYILFLKGLGLSYTNAMRFWQEEFTKGMDVSKFEKQYSYNIKHAYGKVGNMVNYTPYSCMKIIMNNVGQGEHHGCPFKHWDSSLVRQRMVENGLGSEGIDSVMDLVKGGHFQIACGKYFEHSHCGKPPNVINHPNQYVEESLNILEEKKNKK